MGHSAIMPPVVFVHVTPEIDDTDDDGVTLPPPAYSDIRGIARPEARTSVEEENRMPGGSQQKSMKE